ncbi:4-hydroxy-tetrahydrodipicolinate synthase [Paenibacillus sp. OV219]|uniref:4-hydroxy-tetrahydrodipicolinate synthase n=1 Tax=Paenibacillus sp. OV219 TaxID=1884377 RepID=UPI0008C20BB4|nr:4-hydroxy-tetrahydrodipicolinate synthase [Paenibacillus sp. OV219]SEO97729.1 4-hydroxy-tetrahydrodipicolinate synthase [Paenibacillus sp. OV219]
MLKEENLRGIIVPVVTPFSHDGSIDEISYDRYLMELLNHDIQGLVINGTTGESPTVTWEEVSELVQRTKAIIKSCGKSTPVIVGTGTNDTQSTINRTKLAAALGADAALVVVPYYSRPSQAGILEHFRLVAQTGVPIIAYEVPYRTGVRLSADTAAAILAQEGIIGLKDSSGGIELIAALNRLHIVKPVLCGEDAYFLRHLNHGAAGGILAAANLRTEMFIETYRQHRDGHSAQAAKAFDSLIPLIELLFRESNPAPLKWLLSRQCILASATLRLPMMPITEALQQQLAKEMGYSAIGDNY